MSRSTIRLSLLSLLTLLALWRITSTFRIFSQAFDEPAHIACGMEWLDKHTYTLEALHPPLARVASALGPYLEGLRLGTVPVFWEGSRRNYNINAAGDEILYANGQYLRNLTLARLGMLPFFLLSIWIVFSWGRKLYGDAAALIGVAIFTLTPTVLAFAGLAYTDPPLMALLPATLLAFAQWLEKPSSRRTAILGVVGGLCILTKFTSLLFLPACGASILACWAMARWKRREETAKWGDLFLRFGVAFLIVLFVIWGGYRFQAPHIKDAFERPREDVAALKIASPIRSLLLRAVDADVRIPAPALLQGIAADLRMNEHAPPSYALGKVRHGGWWYFFLLALTVKTPLAFLVLVVVGAVPQVREFLKEFDWRRVVPLASAVAMLIVTMPAKVNYGVRHILPIYPLLAIVAGYGVVRLWNTRGVVLKVVAGALLLWLGIASVRAHPDYIAYFNGLAGSHPENVLLWGCDFDCGQDVFKLAAALREKNVQHVTLHLFTSADLTQMGLPSFDTLEPYQLTTGWVAASVRLIDTGDVFVGQGDVDAYAWLKAYKPVVNVGNTIRLYYIEPRALPESAVAPKVGGAK